MAEVVLSVSFEPIEELGVVPMGLLWSSKFSDRFPHVEEQPPWDAPIERFGVPTPAPAITLQALQIPPLPRLWFVDEAGTQLVQIQRNWFARNWRKTETEPRYPRYPSLRQPFEDDLRAFLDFVRENKLGDWTPNQCEVTYVNHIEREGVWQHHGEIDKAIALASVPRHTDFLPTPEIANFSAQYLIPSPDGEPVGRLYVAVQPGFKRDGGDPILLLTLTARGRPAEKDVEGVMEFLDLGREWVVRGFANVTTPEMHVQWRRRDGS